MNDLDERIEAAEKKLEVLQACMDNVKQEIEELKKDKTHGEIPDFPEFNCMDITYTLDSCLDVLQEEHGGGTGDGDYTGDDAHFYNNFHSADYAHEFRRKCLLIAMMLHCKWYIDRDFIQDWRDKLERKWQLYYDHDAEKMVVGAYSHSDFGVIFSTEENAQKCADWINAHWKEECNGTET